MYSKIENKYYVIKETMTVFLLDHASQYQF